MRLALPLVPATLDPAKAADLPSLNVVHELNAGLTRFSGRGVEPDLAESWEPSQNGLVWTFHLRKGLRWSDDAPITAEDFRRSWLRALAPSTHSAYARAEMQNIRGARRYRVTGTGDVGVEAVDDRTLRVTLQHPVPWLDEQVAWPVFFPVPKSGSATSGPFRLASRTRRRLVLERNFNYWNVAAVKPKRIVLTRFLARRRRDSAPRHRWRPGFPGSRPRPPAGRLRQAAAHPLAGAPLALPRGGPARGSGGTAGGCRRSRPWRSSRRRSASGRSAPSSRRPCRGPRSSGSLRFPTGPGGRPLELTLAYTPEDPRAGNLAAQIQSQLGRHHIRVTLRPVSSRMLLTLAGPPPQVDLVLLGWSSEFFDEYNILDLFPCASAFNVAQWCDRSYDRLDAPCGAGRSTTGERWADRADARAEAPAGCCPRFRCIPPASTCSSRTAFAGFGWSPIGFYELIGMTRS